MKIEQVFNGYNEALKVIGNILEQYNSYKEETVENKIK